MEFIIPWIMTVPKGTNLLSAYVISIFERDVLKEILSASDSEMDRRAVEAVKAAINKAKICKKPIAGYDKEKKAAYIEYLNGDRKYAEYNGNKAIIEIDTARCIKGAFPSRQLELILAWCVLHQDELMQN